MPTKFLISILWLPLVTTLPNQFTTEYFVGKDGVGYTHASVVHLIVDEFSPGVYSFSFTVDDPGPVLVAFVDGVPCYDSCFLLKENGENVSLSYEPADYSFSVFQQSNQQTLFFFNGCRQDVSVCKIAAIRSGSFCACENGDNCGEAGKMDTCESTTTSTTTTTTTSLSSSSTYTTSTVTSTILTTIGETTSYSTTTTTSTPSTKAMTTVFTTSVPTVVFTSTIPTTAPSTAGPTTITSSTTITTSTASTSTITTPTARTTSPTSTRKTTQMTTTVPATPFPTFETPTDALKNISDSGITLNNVTESLNTTLGYTENPETLSSEDIYYVASIVTQSANLTGIEEIDAQLILTNIDNVLATDVDKIVASESSQRFIDALPLMVNNCNSSTINFLNGVYLGFTSNELTSGEMIYGLADHHNSFEVLSKGDNNNKLNSISVPENVFKGDSNINKVLFTIYRNKKFFVPARRYRVYGSIAAAENDTGKEDLPDLCDRQNQLPDDSPIMSATFVDNTGSSISKLSKDDILAQLQFNVTSLMRPLHGSYQVTWWDADLQEWANKELCDTKLHQTMVISNCAHLTDFTLIVDSKVNDPAVCDPVLTDVSLTTNAISIFSLFLLIIMQISAYIPFLAATILFQKMLGPGRSPDSIQLLFNVVLFLFYMVFTIFSNQRVSGKACSFMAAFCYSLLFCSILLTIFQAQKTVITLFPRIIRNINQVVMHPLAAFTICFLCPFVLSVILSFFTNFFKRDDGFCWVRPDYVIFATVIPVSVLLLNGIICTVLVVWRMCHVRRKYSRNGKHHDCQLRAKIISILILQITMGMPWIVQYFTLYTPYTTAWHYVFSIIIGSQGTMFCLIYLYKRRRITRRSTEERKRRNVQPNTHTEEEGEIPNYQEYYLASPTV